MSKVWIFADGAQAEARVVGWAGKIPEFMHWFRSGADVHLEVTKLIARYVQENHISIPWLTVEGVRTRPYALKPWSTYTDEDPERQLSKNTVHANDYGMGAEKFALLTGLPVREARLVQDIYFSLIPIRTTYHPYIESMLRKDLTVRLPLGNWRRVFYDPMVTGLDPDTLRKAFAFYASATVGLVVNRTFNEVRRCFGNVTKLRTPTPTAIRACGLDVALQIHDAIGVRVEDDPDVIAHAISIIRKAGEFHFQIRGEDFHIPFDFKVGATWAKKDLRKWKSETSSSMNPPSNAPVVA